MDTTIDETIARSKTDQGAVNANAMRQRQAKERTQIQADIAKSQKTIATLNEERAPIAAEIRKVEAEVGPLKYIAAFIYGATDESILERAVTWVIITIIVVFDPLAIIMLLAAQMTFGWKRENPVVEEIPAKIEPTYPKDDGPLTTSQVEQIDNLLAKNAVAVEPIEQTHREVPSETLSTALGGDITAPEEPAVPNTTESELEKWNKMIEEAEKEVLAQQTTVEERVAKGETYINNDGKEIALEVDLPLDESKKKTYMIKDDSGAIQIKNR
jgi:hypothetical protein